MVEFLSFGLQSLTQSLNEIKVMITEMRNRIIDFEKGRDLFRPRRVNVALQETRYSRSSVRCALRTSFHLRQKWRIVNLFRTASYVVSLFIRALVCVTDEDWHMQQDSPVLVADMRRVRSAADGPTRMCFYQRTEIIRSEVHLSIVCCFRL